MKQNFFIAIIFICTGLAHHFQEKASVIKQVSLCKCMGNPDAMFTIFWGKQDTIFKVQTGRLNRSMEKKWPHAFTADHKFNWARFSNGSTLVAISKDSLFTQWFHFKIYKQ